MIFKIILAIFILLGTGFVAFRFGLFEFEPSPEEEITEIRQLPTPTIAQPTYTVTSTSTTSARVRLLETPTEATAGQGLSIKWFVDNEKIATISHTAVHFGRVSRENPKLPSDYPEKTAILKGAIPASFSAELKVALPGLYFYRAHAIVDEVNIWSEEKKLTVISPTPTPTPRP